MTVGPDTQAFIEVLSADLYGVYEMLRTVGPVCPTPVGVAVVDHRAADHLLRRNDLGKRDAAGRPVSSVLAERVLGRPAGAPPPDVAAVLDATVVSADGPGHSPLRRVLAQMMASWDDGAIGALAQRHGAACTATAVASGSVDVMSGLARPLSAEILCTFLGIDLDRAEEVEVMSRQLTRLVDPFTLPDDPEVVASVRTLVALTDQLFGSGDLAGTELLRHALADGILRDEDEVRGALLTLIVAGHQTVAHTIGNACWIVDSAPAELDIRAFAAEDVWDEVLRLECPVQTVGRMSAEPIELDGSTIPADEPILICLGAANRDPAAFDEPARFDPSRANLRAGLAFGAGARACLGRRIAGWIGRIAVPVILDVLDELAVDGSGMQRGPGLNVRGFDRLVLRPRPVR